MVAMGRNGIRRQLSVLFLGQLVSLFLAFSSFASSYIAHLGKHPEKDFDFFDIWIHGCCSPLEGVDTPLTQCFFTYLAMSLVFGSIFLYQRKELLVPWYCYLILAILNVHANYLVIQAYQYSSITSVTLLDCCTIPWVIILTWLVLRTRYSLWQFFASAICIVGLMLLLLSDAHESDGGGRNPILGDILVIIATICFAFCNVGEEFCAKKKDRVELLAMLSVFSMLIIMIEIPIFERKNLASAQWSPIMIALFAGYAATSFLYGAGGVLVLELSGSTLFNLSLLTSGLWAVLIRIFFYQQQVNWLYYLAFAVVAVGLMIYSLTDITTSTKETSGNEEAWLLTEDSS